MRAGRLNKRVWLQDAPTGRDPVTGEVLSGDEHWVPVAELWAGIEPVAGSERWNRVRVSAEVSHVVHLRYREVKPGQRFVYGTRKLNVVGVVDVQERHRELQVLCAEEV